MERAQLVEEKSQATMEILFIHAKHILFLFIWPSLVEDSYFHGKEAKPSMYLGSCKCER